MYFSYEHIFLSLVALSTFTSVRGWKIDRASCEKEGIYEQVRSGVDEAFRYARAGKAALDAAQVRSDGVKFKYSEVPPRPKELQDLIKYIFAHDDIINESQDRPDVPAFPADDYKQTLKRLKLKHVYQRLSGVMNAIHGPGETDTPGDTDVIIYCNTDRLDIKKGSQKWAYDRENDITYAYKQRNCAGIERFGMAETFSSRENDKGKKIPNTITLCPGLLSYLRRNKRTRNYLVDKASSIKSGTINFVLKESAPIDIHGHELATVLLHEFTHTSGAEEVDDIKTKDWNPGSIFQKKYFGMWDSTGWKRIKKLAKTNPYVDETGIMYKTKPDNNADSIAYFAMGCALMSDDAFPRRILENGDVEKMNRPINNWVAQAW